MVTPACVSLVTCLLIEPESLYLLPTGWITGIKFQTGAEIVLPTTKIQITAFLMDVMKGKDQQHHGEIG